MIFKQVAGLEWRRRIAENGPLRRVIQHALVARIAISILMLPTKVVAADVAPLSPPLVARLDAHTAQSTDAALTAVFQTQNSAGVYAPDDESTALLSRPILATMAFDAYSATRNTASLAQAGNSIARYYSYLFSASDRDGDRLIESSTILQGREARIEDPALNALLAVDLRNLARINLELRRTMQALYWYDGGRSVERAVVAATFDPEAVFCFAREPVTGHAIRRVAPAAGLPSGFSLVVGENHAERMRTHVVTWASQAVVNVAPAERAGNAIDMLSAVAVLGAGNHAAVIDALRRAMPLPSAVSAGVERYALARSRVDVPLTDNDVIFGLFLGIERATAFPDNERFRIEQALPHVRALALAPAMPPITPADADAAIKTVYSTISVLRDRLRTTPFFNPDDKRGYPGIDPHIAALRLLDDMTMLMHRAENRLFALRYASEGGRIEVTLADDHVVVMDNLTVRWQVSTSNAALVWKSVSAGVFGEAIAPIGGAQVVVTPSAPLRFTTRAMARGNAGALRLLTLTALFVDGTGAQFRSHFYRSVYLSPPVGVTAHFPNGRTVEASTLPIRLVARRFAGQTSGLKYFWFSPGGLRLTEGNTGQILFGASDSTVVNLHVEIPSPCRPGVFPFTLKFYSGERDAGTIASSLFKPYLWTYVGPFPPEGGLKVKLPPEQGVNLLQTYPGPNGAARWRPVPETACDPRGGIALRSLAADHGVHFLYTVVACAYETALPVRLYSNVPATLFVNGQAVASVTEARPDSAAAEVHFAPDRNHILIKVLGDHEARVAFGLGNDDNLAADEFDNNLAELAGGYRELTARELAMGSAPSESRRLVTLRFQDPEAGSVAVVGSFNGWSPATNPMRKQGDTDVWELTLSLAPGRYAYRFVVDQKKQVLDPSSTATEPDGYGGRNSVMIIKK